MAVEQNAFLNIEDKAVKGNATIKGHEDEIVVESAGYSIAQMGEWEEKEQLTGRVTHFSDLNVTKVMDNASPDLALACATKRQFKKAVLKLVAGGTTYLEVTAESVIVTNVSVSYSSGMARPSENITLSYRKATWRFGTATHSYDLAANQGT